MPAAAGQIVVDSLTKDFGAVRAVDNLSFSVEPGTVTGFLGPNGAGKTTTLRILLGLVTATSGTATIGGVRYVDLPDPTRTVGAALEASSFHPGRSARDHLRVLCTEAGLPTTRGDELLAQVGLADARDRRVGGYSLGMRQRLALASALLGEPHVLVLDEPANGLDPEGMAWLRGFLRFLAGQGRTILVSSHVLAEVAQTVDTVIIISRGRLVRQASLAELTASSSPRIIVRSPDASRFRTVLENAGHAVDQPESELLLVSGTGAARIGQLALRELVELHELAVQRSDLEQVFLQLTTEAEETPTPQAAAAVGTAATSTQGVSR